MENNSSNILTPIVDVICDTIVLSCKGLYSMILKSMGKESDFDFNSYFKSVNLFTKNDKNVIITGASSGFGKLLKSWTLKFHGFGKLKTLANRCAYY